MQQEERVRERVLLGIEDQVHVALAVQRHILGAVRADMRKAHRLEHAREARPRLGVDRELDELEAMTDRRGWGGKRARSGRFRGKLLLEQQQRAHRVDRGRAWWRGAEFAVEDL